MQCNLALATLGLLVMVLTGCSKQEGPSAAIPEVYVAEVVQQDVPIYMEIVGQTQGSQDVDIRARVEKKEVIIGFGHPVYTVSDPRNVVIKAVAERLADLLREAGAL